jgi:tetrahydromethanopterin S-methyltransferase subunit F
MSEEKDVEIGMVNNQNTGPIENIEVDVQAHILIKDVDTSEVILNIRG